MRLWYVVQQLIRFCFGTRVRFEERPASSKILDVRQPAAAAAAAAAVIVLRCYAELIKSIRASMCFLSYQQQQQQQHRLSLAAWMSGSVGQTDAIIRTISTLQANERVAVNRKLVSKFTDCRCSL